MVATLGVKNRGVMNKFTWIIKYLLLALFVVGLVAPFTFQQPVLTDIQRTTSVSNKPIKVEVEVEVKKVEKPLHRVELPDFAAIRNVKEKKRQFFNFIRPSIIKENGKLLEQRAKISHLLTKLALAEPLSDEDNALLNKLSKKFRLNKRFTPMQKVNELMNRIDIVPSPLILVQAANESAWGTSRFARIGLNFFGIWCYKPGCGMVPNGRDPGATHEVAKFNSVDEAVRRYLFNINTNSAYAVFRSIRRQLRDQNQPLTPEILATGLLAYSERGSAYVLEITNMIRHNRAYF